jgi:hypothetical protein
MSTEIDDLLEYEDPTVPEEIEDVGDSVSITQPFDPAKIRVETKQLSLDTLLSRIDNEEIILQPDFQRKEVWKDEARSRLIESILIRIPLPAFYMDASDDEKWLVVDGQQRLSTLKRFVLDKTLKLHGLEFLSEFSGFDFDRLPRPFQRRIRETNVTVYLIERGTPSAVKINIFKRINTGGLPLSPQEIRHALNGAPVTDLLRTLASSLEFQKVTRHKVPSERMADREYVARFFSFLLTSPADYSAQEFDSFLNDTMARINKMDAKEISNLDARFRRSMKICSSILGKHAFRKRYELIDRLKPINKALFETWSINLEALSDTQIGVISSRQSLLWEKFILLMHSRPFEQSVSQGTGDIQRVRLRFRAIKELLDEVLA